MPPPRRTDDRDTGDPLSWSEVAQELDEAEAQLHALRGQYEQFFMGMEKRPPVWAHEQFRKRLKEMKTAPAKNAGLTFRFQSLQASLVTYERLWSRTLQEMEDGTYRRDIYKLRRKNSDPAVSAARPPEASPGKATGRRKAAQGKEADKPASPAQPPDAAAPPEPVMHIAGTPPVDPLSETRLRSVYRAYVEAKRRCNEDTTRLSFDAVAASLKRQVPELLDRHKVRDVEYRVFVKDGKAILRAVPKI